MSDLVLSPPPLPGVPPYELVWLKPVWLTLRDLLRPIDEQHAFSLGRSIQYDGQLTPVIAYKDGDLNVVADGAHRVTYCLSAERPVWTQLYTSKPPEDFLARLRIVPNVTQRSLDALAILFSIESYKELKGCTLEQAAEEARFDRSLYYKYLPIRQLPTELIAYVRAGKLKADPALALVKVTDPEEQRRLAGLAIAKQITAKEIRAAVAGKNGSAKEKAPKITWPKGWVAKQKAEWHLTESKKHGGK